MSHSLHASRVLITGASGGIGRALAHELARLGCELWLVGRRRDTLEALREELPKGVVTSLLALDLTHVSDREALSDALLTCPQSQRPFLVVHLAGVNEVGWFAQQSSEKVERLLDINLTSTILLAQQLLPILALAEKAQLMLVGSMLGHIGHPGNVAYCASKAGLRGFSEALARELADSSVKIQYIAPRATRTPINPRHVEQMNAALGNAIDEPESVARLVVKQLASGQVRQTIGWAERCFGVLNSLWPGLLDRGLAGKRQVMERHLGPLSHTNEKIEATSHKA
ncbi:SDR family oxidoreductase [Cobetia amphilecti]|uniref:SDR family oxidoreductase n=1 Tax=Cobetia amphilecti TaxID=1055104 RepID=UPI0006944C1C|nr:SDR family oxidoreductase [Cobetia amphilecti]